LVIEIRKTRLFAQWLDELRDLQARARSTPGLNGLLLETRAT
jgi:putative component of toxin-antitoxin plasmid stabilization module